MAKNKNILFVVLFSGAFLVAMAFLLVYIASFYLFQKDITFGRAVAVVDITGEIFYDQSKIEELEDYAANDHVKAVVLHINSPGGGVAASQELYHTVRRLRAKKPVVACMGEVAASGGYYVACAADSIVAHEGTITGSIGVIATFLRTEELFQKIGLDVTVVKRGKYKDIGSPYRKMSQEEKEYIGRLLDKVYKQFVAAVSEGRGMSESEVLEVAEGRLFSGEEALEKGLVDKLGTLKDAVDMAARMGGIEGTPKIVRRRPRKTLLERLWGENAARIGLPDRSQRIALKYIVP
jgi:protease-4